MSQLRFILFGLQLITVLFLGTLLVLVGLWTVHRHSLLEPEEQTMCVESKHNAVTKKAVSCKENLCCGPVSQILALLNYESVAKMYNDEGHPDNIDISIHMQDRCSESKTKPVHLELYNVDSSVARTGSSASKLFWEYPASSLAAFGIRYLPTDGSIYVETAGLYYVASQLTLTVKNTTLHCSNCSDSFSHSVVMVSHQRRKETTVLQRENSPCNIHAEESLLTSSLGGMFCLDVRDRVYIAASHPEKITTDGGRNNFHMYYLPDYSPCRLRDHDYSV